MKRYEEEEGEMGVKNIMCPLQALCVLPRIGDLNASSSPAGSDQFDEIFCTCVQAIQSPDNQVRRQSSFIFVECSLFTVYGSELSEGCVTPFLAN